MELAKLRSALSHLRFFKINIKNNCQNVCAFNVHALQCGVTEAEVIRTMCTEFMIHYFSSFRQGPG